MCELVSVSFNTVIRIRCWCDVLFFQAEDGIRDLVRSRGLGDVYKRQLQLSSNEVCPGDAVDFYVPWGYDYYINFGDGAYTCLLYTSDAADERSSVDLGGRRIIKKKTSINN